jgi:predicted nucleic acid-binding Zn ribbon protein
MNAYRQSDEDWEEKGWENEMDDEMDDDYEVDSWDDDQLDEPLIDCPHCGAEIHEESQRCPRCENYISDADLRARRRKPPWIIITAVVCILAILQFYLLGLFLLTG